MLVDYVRVYQKDFAKDDVNAPSIPQMRPDKTTLSSTTASVKWFASADNNYVKQYQFYLNDEFVDNMFSTAYDFTNLQPDTTYKVSVKAEDFAGNVSEAGIIQFKTLGLDTVPGIIEAEKYIELSNGALRDSSEDDTQIIYGMKKFDYVVYTFNVLETGNYYLNLRLSNFGDSGSFAVYTIDEDGNNLDYYRATTIPATGGYDRWSTVSSSKPIHLVEGKNTIKIFARSTKTYDVFWLNWIKIEKTP